MMKFTYFIVGIFATVSLFTLMCILCTISCGQEIDCMKVSHGHYALLTAWSAITCEKTKNINDNNIPLFTGLIATGDASGEILIRRFPTGNLVSRYQDRKPIKKLVFSPCGSKIAFVISDGYDFKIKNNTDKVCLLAAENESSYVLEGDLFPRLKGEILSVNFSYDESKLELFVRGAMETAKEVFDISDTTYFFDENASLAKSFRIANNGRYSVQSGSNEECLNSKIKQFIEINTVYAADDTVDIENYLHKNQRLEWTEKQLIGAKSFLSPNDNTVATLFPDGTMHLWNASTGFVFATHKFNLSFDTDRLPTEVGKGEIIWNTRFSPLGNEMLLLTNKSVIIFDISNNDVKAVCYPPLSAARRGLSLTISVDSVVNASLYQDKILLVETMDLILAYELGSLKTPVMLINKSEIDEHGSENENNEAIFSMTGKYIAILTSRQIEGDQKRQDCFIWDSRTLSKTALPHGDFGLPVMFSRDDRYLLFQKEPENSEEKYSFFRMSTETMEFEQLNLSKSFENIVGKSSNRMFSDQKKGRLSTLTGFRFFYGNSSCDKYFTEQHKGYTLIFSGSNFDLLDLSIDNDSSLLNWQGTFCANTHSYLDRHQVFTIDQDSCRSSVTFFFGEDDYLVLYSDGQPTGSPKGLNRLNYTLQHQ